MNESQWTSELIAIIAGIATIIGVVVSVLFQYAKASPTQRRAVTEWITSSTNTALTMAVVVGSVYFMAIFFSSDAPLTRIDLLLLLMVLFNLFMWPANWLDGRRKRRNQEVERKLAELLKEAQHRMDQPQARDQ